MNLDGTLDYYLNITRLSSYFGATHGYFIIRLDTLHTLGQSNFENCQHATVVSSYYPRSQVDIFQFEKQLNELMLSFCNVHTMILSYTDCWNVRLLFHCISQRLGSLCDLTIYPRVLCSLSPFHNCGKDG